MWPNGRRKFRRNELEDVAEMGEEVKAKNKSTI
jgi:hypothetical protein